MADHQKIQQLRAALGRELAKQKRQTEALKATEAMVNIISEQITAEEKKK